MAGSEDGSGHATWRKVSKSLTRLPLVTSTFIINMQIDRDRYSSQAITLRAVIAPTPVRFHPFLIHLDSKQ